MVIKWGLNFFINFFCLRNDLIDNFNSEIGNFKRDGIENFI